MNQNNQSLLKALIAVVIIAALIASVIIITEKEFAEGKSKTLSICFSLIFYGLTGSICWAVSRKRENVLLGNAGIVVSGLAFVFLTILILGESESQDMAKIAFSLMIAAIALAHISFLFYITVQNKYATAARIVATIGIAVFSLLIISKIFSPWEEFMYMPVTAEKYLRAVFASLIIDLAATLLVPLCNKLDTKPKELELETKIDPPPTNSEPFQPNI